MKKWERRGVVFIGEGNLGDSECRRPGEFAVAVIVEDLLQVSASVPVAMKISIAFAKCKVSVRAPRATWVVIEIFLIFRGREIVHFASEQAIGVLELTLISPFTFARRRLRKFID